jgi:hypothetical protein
MRGMPSLRVKTVDGAVLAADEQVVHARGVARRDRRDGDVAEARGRDVVAQHGDVVRRGLDGDDAAALAREPRRMHGVVADVGPDVDDRRAGPHEAIEQSMHA